MNNNLKQVYWNKGVEKMAKLRQDAWSHEDDLLLAETVLRHIREGSTQLNAFEEVGDELNRTSAACGFRWNAEVRNKYISAIDLAKRQRKDKKRKQRNNLENPIPQRFVPEKNDESNLIMEPEETDASEPELSLQTVISYLQTLERDMYQSSHMKTKSEQLQYENRELIAKIDQLEKELALKDRKLKTVEEDYHTFIQIMERARKMTVLEDQGTANSPAFKMDKNGNLEQIIHTSSK
jgi:prespore-specific regulator